MTITASGDTVTYDNGAGSGPGARTTAGGVIMMGATGPLGTSSNPLVTQTSSLQTTADLTTVRLAISTATTTAAVTATALQRTRAYRWRINVGAAQTLTIQSASTVLEILAFTGAAVLTYDFATRPWHTTAVNEALNIVSSTTAATNIVLEYTKNAL